MIELILTMDAESIFSYHEHDSLPSTCLVRREFCGTSLVQYVEMRGAAIDIRREVLRGHRGYLLNLTARAVVIKYIKFAPATDKDPEDLYLLPGEVVGPKMDLIRPGEFKEIGCGKNMIWRMY